MIRAAWCCLNVVRVAPCLRLHSQRLLESVTLSLDEVNTLPGLEVSLRHTQREKYPHVASGAGGAAAVAAAMAAASAAAAAQAAAAAAAAGASSAEAAAAAAAPLLVPFEVTATLKMPPVLDLRTPEVVAALHTIEVGVPRLHDVNPTIPCQEWCLIVSSLPSHTTYACVAFDFHVCNCRLRRRAAGSAARCC